MSHPLLATVIFLSILHFVTHFSCVPAVNLKECRRRIQNQRKPHILPPPPPSPLNTPENCTSPPLIISYELCLTECGAGMGDIDWRDFSQNFGAWFLPWISLMFQIPFGAERKLLVPTFISCLTRDPPQKKKNNNNRTIR